MDTIRTNCTETRKINIAYDSSHCIAAYQFSSNNLSLSFTNLSNVLSTDSVDYRWSFGDGNYSFQSNPVHVFAGNGLYNVCLYVRQTDSSSIDSCMYCQSIYVQNNDTVSTCNADFNYSISANTVTLSALSPSNYSSIWFDGYHSPIYGNNPVITFPDSGTYEICHRSIDSLNINDTCVICKTIRIVISQVDTASHCNADFSATITGNNVALSATHYSTYSLWYDNYHGSLFYGSDSTVTFPDSGTYEICHRSIDSLNVYDTCVVCKSITILPAPDTTTCDADFSYVISGNTVSVIADSANMPGRLYTWTFDNEYGVPDSTNVSYTFATEGLKKICLKGYTFTNGYYTDSCVTCKELSIGSDSLVSRPNPANEYLTFSVSKGLIKSIHIHDIHGTQVKEVTGLSTKEYEVNVADLAKGIYHATIKLHDNRSYKSTVIIE